LALIGVDATFINPGRVGGAEQMLKAIVSGLDAVRSPEDELILFGQHKWQVSPRGGMRWVQNRDTGNRFLQAWLATMAHGKGLDAMLFPNYFTPPLFRRGGKPRFVTVIHDLQYLYYPENFSFVKRLWLRAAHEVTLRVADLVVAVSQHVQADIGERYGHKWKDKTIAIPNPVLWERFDAGGPTATWDELSRQWNLPNRRYVLSVSAHYAHKNLETLLLAFSLLQKKREFRDLVLVLVGQLGRELVGVARYANLEKRVRDTRLSGAVAVTGHVSDADLGEFYRHAGAFVFPSLFEGYGLPPVEALGFGIPVITTRCTSLPESTLGLATYVEDPLDPGLLADKLGEVLSSPEKHRLPEIHVRRVREFHSVERIGREYYRALMRG
jgi:glycosyltransferase involved in cell wall biosynthesis